MIPVELPNLEAVAEAFRAATPDAVHIVIAVVTFPNLGAVLLANSGVDTEAACMALRHALGILECRTHPGSGTWQ